MTKKEYRGYCTHNAFGDYKMPVPAQNIIYRDYANKNILDLKLSVNELFFPNCFLQLFGLINELDNLDGILMCSRYMLPNEPNKREMIFKKIVESNAELHFVLENVIIKNEDDIFAFENLAKINSALKKAPISFEIANVINETVDCC